MDEYDHPGTAQDATDPLVRLSAIAPFVSYLKARRLDVKPVLKRWGLTEAAMRDPERLVHAELNYGLVNDFAREAKDPYLGLHVGEYSPLQDWLFTQGAFEEGATLGTTLIRMIETIPQYGQTVHHHLEVGSDVTIYRILRPYRTRNLATQSDGLGTSVCLRVLDLIEGGWEPAAVTILTQFPEAMPNPYRGVQITVHEDAALDIAFPTAWCHRPLTSVRKPLPVQNQPTRVTSIIDALETVVPYLLTAGAEDLKAAVARNLGLTPADLESALRKHGTSLSREVRALRLRLARRKLAETEAPISRIANDLGFSEAANFTRFFRGETGMTPRQYRKSRPAEL